MEQQHLVPRSGGPPRLSKVRPKGLCRPKYRRANFSLTTATLGYRSSQRKSRPATPRNQVLLLHVSSGQWPLARTNRVCALLLISAYCASADSTPGSDLTCCVTRYQISGDNFTLLTDSSVRTRAGEKPVG